MPLPEQDIHYFIDVTLTHLNKLTGNEITLRSPTIEFQSLVFSAYTGLLHLKGNAEGFVYITASQQFLSNLYAAKGHNGRASEENCREVIGDVTGHVAQLVTKRFGPTLKLSEPRIFSTVPDDPIEMPPAVFVQPVVWRKEHAYIVLGLASAEMSLPKLRMTGTEIYKRTATYESEARSIRIHAPHWKVLLAYDGQRTLSEVAISADTPYTETVTLTQTFLDKKWIAEEPITLDQYLKRIGTKDVATTGAVVAPAVVLHDPEKDKTKSAPPPGFVSPVAAQPPIAQPTPVPVAVPAPIPVAPPVSLPPPLPPPGTKTAPVPIAAVPAPAPIPAPVQKRVMKLSSVVDYITTLVGNVSLGQILVYRVFLRVPPELLLAEDIASVHLSGDTSLINGEKLQKAIADAVNAVAKKALPDSVYA